MLLFFIATEGHVVDILDTNKSSGYVGDTCDRDEELDEEESIPLLTRTLSTNDQLLIVSMVYILYKYNFI